MRALRVSVSTLKRIDNINPDRIPQTSSARTCLAQSVNCKQHLPTLETLLHRRTRSRMLPAFSVFTAHHAIAATPDNQRQTTTPDNWSSATPQSVTNPVWSHTMRPDAVKYSRVPNSAQQQQRMLVYMRLCKACSNCICTSHCSSQVRSSAHSVQATSYSRGL